MRQSDTAVANAIETFLSQSRFAVVGASRHRHKIGNKIFRRLIQCGYPAVAVHPFAESIEGHLAYRRLTDVTPQPSVSIATPPTETGRVVEDAIDAGVTHVWIEPYAIDAEASRTARRAGLNLIDDGTSLLIVLTGL